MTLKVSAIDRVADDAYRLTLEVGGKALVYVVRVSEEPVPLLQAPDALWKLLGNDREPIKNLADAVFQVHWRHHLALPLTIRQALPSADAEAAEVDQLAGARH